MSEERWPLRTSDRLGRLVLLPVERWEHVVRRHGELATERAFLLRAVRYRDVVTTDAVHPNRQCCYALVPGANKKLKVVVEYSGEEDLAHGTILTAYLTERIPAAEVQRWP